MFRIFCQSYCKRWALYDMDFLWAWESKGNERRGMGNFWIKAVG